MIFNAKKCILGMICTRFANGKCGKIQFMFIDLDGTPLTGRPKDFHTTKYKGCAFRKCYFRLQIQCTNGLSMVLKLAKNSPFPQQFQ